MAEYRAEASGTEADNEFRVAFENERQRRRRLGWTEVNYHRHMHNRFGTKTPDINERNERSTDLYQTKHFAKSDEEFKMAFESERERRRRLGWIEVNYYRHSGQEVDAGNSEREHRRASSDSECISTGIESTSLSSPVSSGHQSKTRPNICYPAIYDGITMKLRPSRS